MVQCPVKVILVNEPAPCDIHNHGIFFHLRKCLTVKDMMGFSGQRGMDGYNIRLP